MQNIALAQNVTFEKGEQPFQSLVTIEPLHPGYGATLGNSLRRVLLSSLPGTAVVGVKIKGADHEFMALPNIKEDVLEIVLNLKQLAMRVHSDEIVKLELVARGEKEVTANDIKANSDVEIINKDLVLCHITDPAGSLEMEIYVSRGMGYETIENREDRNKEIGYIEIDSIFSPVLSAGASIDNTRVGKMTNWDKVTLSIMTDGSIEPKEAFQQSVQILINQFKALLEKEEVSEGEETESAETEKTEEETIETENTAENKEDLSKLTREQLNEMAVTKGVEDADKLKTKDEVIDAINNQ